MKPKISLSLAICALCLVGAGIYLRSPATPAFHPAILATRTAPTTAFAPNSTSSPKEPSTLVAAEAIDPCQESNQLIDEDSRVFLGNAPAWLHPTSQIDFNHSIQKITENQNLIFTASFHERARDSKPIRTTLTRQDWLRLAREHAEDAAFDSAMRTAFNTASLFESRPATCPDYPGLPSLRTRLLGFVDQGRARIENAPSVRLRILPPSEAGKPGKAHIFIDNTELTHDQTIDDLVNLRETFEHLGESRSTSTNEADEAPQASSGI